MFKQFNSKNLILAALVLVLIATGCTSPTAAPATAAPATAKPPPQRLPPLPLPPPFRPLPLRLLLKSTYGLTMATLVLLQLV